MTHPTGYQAGTTWVQVLLSFDGSQKAIEKFTKGLAIHVPVKLDVDEKGLNAEVHKAAAQASKSAVVTPTVHVVPKQATHSLNQATRGSVVTPAVHVDRGQAQAAVKAATRNTVITPAVKVNTAAATQAQRALKVPTKTQQTTQTVGLVAKSDQVDAKIREIRARRNRTLVEIDANTAKYEARIRLLKQVKVHKNVDVDAELSAYNAKLKGLQKERETKTIKVKADIDDATKGLNNLEKTLKYKIVTAERGIERATRALRNLPIEAEKAAEKGVPFDIKIKTKQLEKEIAYFRARVETLPIEFRPKIDEAKRRLKELVATKFRATVDIDADIAGVQAKIAQLEKLKPHINVDVDAEMTKLRAELALLTARRATVQIKADADVTKAQAELAGLQQKVDRLNGSRADIGIEAEDASNAIATMGRLFVAISAISYIAPAAAAAVALIPEAVIAAGAAVGVAAAGFNGISDAVKALQAVQDEQATSSDESAQKQVASANRVADAQSSVARAQASAAHSAASNAESIRTATEGVADAQRSAARGVESAERNLASAQQDARDAQLSLNEARKQAKEQLDDLRLSVKGAALDEEDAVLGVLRARERLADAQKKAAKPGQTDISKLDLAEMALGVRQAEQNLAEVRERYADLKTEAVAANKAGVNGSQLVVAAQRQVQEANTNVADQERELREAREQGARQVAKAQQAVAQAQQNAAYSAASAAQSVADAQRNLAQASQESLDTSTASTDKLAIAMGKLTPEGQAFAHFLQDSLKPSLTGIGDAAAKSMLPKVQGALTDMMVLAPLAERQFANIGSTIGDLAQEAADRFTSDEWLADFEEIGSRSNKTLHTMGETGLNLVDVFKDLFVSSGPFVSSLFRSFEQGSLNLKQWIDMKRASGDLSRYFFEMGARVRELWTDFKQLVGGVWEMVQAIQPLGRLFLIVAGAIAQTIGAFAKAHPTIFSMVILLGVLFSSFVSLFRAIGGVRKAVGDAVGVFRNVRERILGTKVATEGATKATNQLSTATKDQSTLLGRQGGLLNAAKDKFTAFGSSIKKAYTGGADAAGKWSATLTGSTHVATNAVQSVIPANAAAGGSFSRLRNTASTAFVGISRGAGGVAGALTRTLGGAIGGLIGAMGGLAGLAITGLVVGLGALAASQAEAAQAAAEHEAEVKELQDQLVETGGVVDDNVKKQISDNLEKKSLIDNTAALGLSTRDLIKDIADGKGPSGDFARSLRGVGDEMGTAHKLSGEYSDELHDLVDELITNGGAAKDYKNEIEDLGFAYQRTTGASNDATDKFKAQLTMLFDLAGGYGQVSADTQTAVDKSKMIALAMREAGIDIGDAKDELGGFNENASDPAAIENMSKAIEGMGDKSKTSAEKVDDLNTALQHLRDESITTEEATQGIDDALRGLPDLFAAAQKASGKKFIDPTGAINTTTKAGSDLQNAIVTLSDTFQTQFSVAFDKGMKKFHDQGKAAAYAARQTQASRQRLIDVAKQANLTNEQIQALTKHYKLTPAIVQTTITQPGMVRSILDSLKLGSAVRNVPNTWQVVLTSTTPQQIQLLETLGFKVTHLPSGEVLVTVDSEQAKAELNNLTKTDYKTIAVQLKFDERFRGMSNQQRANALKQIKFESGGAVIPVPKPKPKRKPRPKKNDPAGRAAVTHKAHGEIAEFWATGGIRRMSSRTADIVRSYRETGAQRVIGDNPIADEAYIPIVRSPRSIAILTETAQRLGFDLMPMASGGVVGAPASAGSADDTALGSALDDLSTSTLPALAATVDKSTVPTFQELELHLGTTSVAAVGSLTTAMGPLRQGITSTASTAAIKWQATTTSVTSSTTKQNAAMSGLRSGLAATRSSMSLTASAAVTEFNRVRNAAASPIRAMIAGPFNKGIILAWNRLNKDFALGKPVGQVPIAFRAGGTVPGVGSGDKVRTLLEPQEIVFDRQAIRNLGGVERVERFRRMARAGIVGGGASLKGNGAERLALMRDIPLDGLGFAYGGVVPYVARAGDEIVRKFGPLPGGIGGRAPRSNISDHPSGLALDFMTLDNVALGNRIATYMIANAQRLMLKYLIWQQRYNAGSGWDLMPDRGSSTANHLDHVHASFLALGQKGHGFANAGLVDPAGYFEKAFQMISTVESAFPGNRAAMTSAGIARQAVNGVMKFANDKVGAEQTAGSPQVVAAVRMVARRFGWDKGLEWASLGKLITGESGWNPKAANPTSSAKGLFQKLTSMHGPVEPTAAGQAEWGLPYIKQAYGTPSNAYRQWLSRSPHWYDEGGLLPPGYSTVYSGMSKPEKVLTDNQWSALISLAHNGTSAPAQLTGDLYLDRNGPFLGVIRGEIDQANQDAGLALSRRIR